MVKKDRSPDAVSLATQILRASVEEISDWFGIDEKAARIFISLAKHYFLRHETSDHSLKNLVRLVKEAGKPIRPAKLSADLNKKLPKSVDFHQTKSKYLKAGTLFRDPHFGAKASSIFQAEDSDMDLDEDEIKWLRPKVRNLQASFIFSQEIVDRPQLFAPGASRFDVTQGRLLQSATSSGYLGDCWFLSAMASVAQHRKLLRRVILRDQDFDKNYAGIFRFSFWRYGRWDEVVIDDRLPTIDGKLLFARSEDPTEFWSALLEKAYAKLNGCYEALDGGSITEALEDLTGGVIHNIRLSQYTSKEFYDIVADSFNKSALIGACILGGPLARRCRDDDDSKLNGLVDFHAYTVTAVATVTIKTKPVSLIRVRNPHGSQGSEWEGAWADKSKQWQKVAADELTKLRKRDAKDGEFWMSAEDFWSSFHTADICQVPEYKSDDNKVLIQRQTKKALLRWLFFRRVRHSIAVDTRHLITKDIAASWNTFEGTAESHFLNPQFLIEIEKNQKFAEPDGTASIVLSVLQKHHRELFTNPFEVKIGVYRLERHDTIGAQGQDFFYRKRHAKHRNSEYFAGHRSTAIRFRARPGHYLVVVSTVIAGHDTDFLLRATSRSTFNFELCSSPQFVSRAL